VRGRDARVRAGGARTAQGVRSWQRCAGIPVRVCPLIPPALFSHKGSRGRLGVLMPETKDGTPGLPQKSPPVRFLQPLAPTQGGRGVWASCCLKRKMARQSLPTNLPLQGRAHLRCAPGARASRPRARRRRAHRARGAFLAEMRQHSRAHLPPHPPCPLLPQGEQRAFGRPAA